MSTIYFCRTSTVKLTCWIVTQIHLPLKDHFQNVSPSVLGSTPIIQTLAKYTILQKVYFHFKYVRIQPFHLDTVTALTNIATIKTVNAAIRC